jgi:hypothetical protein
MPDNNGLSVRCLKNETSTGVVLPTVTTDSISSITTNVAVSGGNITNDGGAPVTVRGVCWSTYSNPTISDNFTMDGSGTGTFISNLANLTLNTLYYVRAYATNSTGTAYGNEMSFTTSPSAFTIGQSYGGGIIFYIDSTGQHGFIAAPSDQSTGTEWGCPETLIGTYLEIGTGQANTTAIVNGCSQAGIAARICDDLVLNGYDDWFLPSFHELYELCYKQNVVGGFGNNRSYWSSSEAWYDYEYDYAWFQRFSECEPDFYGKGSIIRVRAIRAF